MFLYWIQLNKNDLDINFTDIGRMATADEENMEADGMFHGYNKGTL